MKSQSKFGFTILELLVVIAIIGILTSIIVVAINSSKAKGRIAAAQAGMHGTQQILQDCLNNSDTINIPESTPGPMCTSGSGSTFYPNYPSLPVGWSYCDGIVDSNCFGNASRVTGGGFFIFATGDARLITCWENGCATTYD